MPAARRDDGQVVQALGLLAETPVEQADGLAVQVAVAVHLHDHQPAVAALSGGDERCCGRGW